MIVEIRAIEYIRVEINMFQLRCLSKFVFDSIYRRLL